MNIPFYSEETQGTHRYFSLGQFPLEEGGVLTDATLAYNTYGSLNEEKTNAILIPTWFSGTTKDMEAFIGKGRAITPEKYFIILVNQLGNGLSTSPHHLEDPHARANFPHIRIGDDVRAQYELVTKQFGLTELALVFGGSMGAQQTYEWGVRYPQFVKRLAPLAGKAKNTVHDFLFTQTLLDAITSDLAWNEGKYNSPEEVVEGLTRHADIWAVMGLSPEFYNQRQWETLGFETVDQFLNDYLRALFRAMDPNALLTMGWKWQRGDVSRHTNGNLKEALQRITAKTFVMPVSTDMFFPVLDCEREQSFIPNSEIRVIDSIFGHFAIFGGEGEAFYEQVDKHLRDLLATE